MRFERVENGEEKGEIAVLLSFSMLKIKKTYPEFKYIVANHRFWC